MATQPAKQDYLTGFEAALQSGAEEIAKVYRPALDQQQAALETATEVHQAAVTKGAEADAAIKSETLGMLRTTEDRIARYADTLAPEELQLEIARELRASIESAKNSLGEVQARSSVSFFDNPAEYLVNSLNLPAAITEHAQAQQRVDLLSDAQHKLNNALTGEAQAIRATQRTVSDAKTAAELAKISAGAAEKAAELDRQMAQDKVQGINARMQLSGQERQMAEGLARAQQMRDDRAFRAEQRAQMREDRQARLEEKTANENAIFAHATLALHGAESVDPAFAGVLRKALYVADPNGQLVPKPGAAKELKNLLAGPFANKALQAKFNYFAERGGASANGQGGYVGESFVEGLSNAKNFGVPLSAKQSQAAGLAAERLAALKESPEYQKAAAADKLEMQRRAGAMALGDSKLVDPPGSAHLPVTALDKVLNLGDNPGAMKDWASYREQARLAVEKGLISATQAANDLTFKATAARTATNEMLDPKAFGEQPALSLLVATEAGKDASAVDITDIVSNHAAFLKEQRSSVVGKIFAGNEAVLASLATLPGHSPQQAGVRATEARQQQAQDRERLEELQRRVAAGEDLREEMQRLVNASKKGTR